MLENTEVAITNGQTRESGKIGHTRQRKKEHNTICVGHHYMQTNRISVRNHISISMAC